MRKKVIAGNWKMNCTVDQAVALTMDLVDCLSDRQNADIIICPPYIDIPSVSMICKGTGINIGAQNMYYAENGAYTGEISYSMIKDFCKYVILGHSERRQIFNESDELINKKVHAALDNGIIPIVCIGETLEENENNNTESKLAYQLKESLKDINCSNEVIIAYEPIWAIGTGKAATAEQAEITLRYIRSEIEKLFGTQFASNTRLLYGGSVKPSNANELLSKENIDGVLVGGASLKSDDFRLIADAVID